jgi:hypothetical protein
VVKAVSSFKRKAGMPVDEFQAYWRTQHPAVVTRLAGIRRYVQSHTLVAAYRKGEPVYALRGDARRGRGPGRGGAVHRHHRGARAHGGGRATRSREACGHVIVIRAHVDLAERGATRLS